MGDIFSSYNNLSVPENATKAELLFMAEKHYNQLIRDFRDEIDFIEGKLESIRQEQIQFYTQTLPEIAGMLRENNSIPQDRVQEWLNVLIEEMGNSFKMSDELVRHYYTENLNEFKSKLNDLMDKV